MFTTHLIFFFWDGEASEPTPGSRSVCFLFPSKVSFLQPEKQTVILGDKKVFYQPKCS